MSRGADAEFPSRTYQPRFIMIQLVPLSWIVMDCHGLSWIAVRVNKVETSSEPREQLRSDMMPKWAK